MTARLVILAPDLEPAARVLTAEQPAAFRLVRTHASPTNDHAAQLRARLAWALVAERSAPDATVLALHQPCALPVAYARMLQRTMLGYRALVVLGRQATGLTQSAGDPRPSPGAGRQVGTPALAPHQRRASATVDPLVGIPVSRVKTLTAEGVLAALRGSAAPAVPGVPTAQGLGRWPTSAEDRVTLIVGERATERWTGPGVRRPAWPFISTWRSGCSAWLAEQLEDAGVPEHHLFWTNALMTKPNSETPDSNQLGAALRLAPWFQVVALGQHAARWCWDNGLAFEHVHHPQYWKRFQTGRPYRLVKLLRRLYDTTT